jgi:hypothetical protein
VPDELEGDGESDLEQQPEGRTYSAADLGVMADAIVAADSLWHKTADGDRVNLGTVSWRPDLQRGSDLCHVHAVPRLGEHWRRRFALADDFGKRVVVAGPTEAWYSPGTLGTLNALDVRAVLLEDRQGKWRVQEHRSVAHLVAKAGLRLPAELLKSMGKLNLGRATAAVGSQQRGDRFEDVLALLFSQVSYFRVYDINFENATEEIDLVVQNLRIPERSLPLTPIVCVSGKNVSDSVGVSALATLEKKMANRHGQCELGFLCASGKIANTIDLDILRLSRTDKIIVPLDGQAISELFEDPEDLDDNLEEHVRRAMLR